MDRRADIYEIRRNKLRSLIEEMGGRQPFLDRTGKGDAQISQLLTGKRADKKGGRNLGNKLAREIEAACGKPYLWLDDLHHFGNRPVVARGKEGDDDAAHIVVFRKNSVDEHPTNNYSQEVVAWEDEEDLPSDEFVFIPRLHVELSAGSGNVVWEVSRKTGGAQAFRLEWLQRKHLNPENLTCMYALGNSMEPYIQDGDALLVDLSKTGISDGEVYAIRYGDEVRVKRLFKRFDTGLRLISDNADFPDEIVEGEDLNNVQVIGRVVWRGG